MELIKKYLSETQINTIIERCRENPAFKHQFITSPHQIIEQVTGIDLVLPEGIQLEVNDQDNSKVAYFNIPVNLNFNNVELSETELDMVTGGTGRLDG